MLRFLDTKHKRKSAALTTAIMSIMLIALFFIGMTYIYTPEEYGIAFNFGIYDGGKGNVQSKE